MNKVYKSLILNLCIVISSLIGIYITIFSNGFMSTKALFYYTIQSNIIVMIISILLIIYDILFIKRKDRCIPKSIYVLKYISAVGIAITFLIFTFALMPQLIIQGNYLYLFDLGNLTLHFITPILCIISFKYFDSCFIETKWTLYLGIIMPLYYYFFSLMLSINNLSVFMGFDGSMSKFPYFFLDYEKNGWFSISGSVFELGVFYWIIIILILSLLLSKFLLKSKRS